MVMPTYVWKYNIPNTSMFELEMPVNAQILSCANQNGSMVMWVAFDATDTETVLMEKRAFKLAKTGSSLEHPFDTLKYIGTVMLWGDSYVLHLFEVIS